MLIYSIKVQSPVKWNQQYFAVCEIRTFLSSCFFLKEAKMILQLASHSILHYQRSLYLSKMFSQLVVSIFNLLELLKQSYFFFFFSIDLKVVTPHCLYRD